MYSTSRSYFTASPMARLLALVLTAMICIVLSTSVHAQVIGDDPVVIPPTLPTTQPIPPGLSCNNGAENIVAECLATAQREEGVACAPIDRNAQADYYACMCKVSSAIAQCYNGCPGQAAQQQIAFSNQQSNCAAAERFKTTTSTRTSTTRRATSTSTETQRTTTTTTASSDAQATDSATANRPKPTSLANDNGAMGAVIPKSSAVVLAAAAGLVAVALFM